MVAQSLGSKDTLVYSLLLPLNNFHRIETTLGKRLHITQDYCNSSTTGAQEKSQANAISKVIVTVAAATVAQKPLMVAKHLLHNWSPDTVEELRPGAFVRNYS